MAATLPTELIEDIGKRLNTKSDVSRFRAICRSWRSSLPAVDSKLQTFNIKIWSENLTQKYAILHVNETAVYHHPGSPFIYPDEQAPRDCLVKLRSPDQGGQVMNLLDFQGFELARAYEFSHDWPWGFVQRFVTSTNIHSADDVMLIYSGSLCHGKSCRDKQGYMNVHRITGDQSFPYYEDIIFYQGMFYAVTSYGKVVVFDTSGNLTKVAVPFSIFKNCDRQTHYRIVSLVESSGDLLLVEFIGRKCPDFIGLLESMLESEVKFKVYKLTAVEKQWVEMQAEDLSDRILVILGHEHCSFSVAAKDFPGCLGNCIYFSSTQSFRTIHGSKVGVFDLSTGTISDLQSLPHGPVLESFSLGATMPRIKYEWCSDLKPNWFNFQNLGYMMQ